MLSDFVMGKMTDKAERKQALAACRERLAAQQQETVASATAPRVGYVQIQEENNGWRNANMQSIHKAARDFGVDLTVAEVPPVLEEQIHSVSYRLKDVERLRS